MEYVSKVSLKYSYLFEQLLLLLTKVFLWLVDRSSGSRACGALQGMEGIDKLTQGNGYLGRRFGRQI